MGDMTGLNTTLTTLEWMELDPESFYPITLKAYQEAVAAGREIDFLEARAEQARQARAASGNPDR